MSKKQATLFQSWGNKAKGTEDRSVQPVPEPSTSSADNDVIDLCGSFEDEDDAILCEAEESVANNSNNAGQSFPTHQGSREYAHRSENSEIHVGDISIGADGFTLTQVQTQSSNCPGFDKCAGKLWIYPTNYPVREYQFNIVRQAMFKNTMVTLPTGLGKTFIAAVVMYNFYRWYPQGKVIFMAPTKPLVAQQIEACYNIMGIPQDHMAEMTGSMGPSKREKAWHDKRVFFLTPQVLTNDLSRGSCPAHAVKCLVIDEAHKALGNHAYCQVVRELVKYTENFRILALSATPGSDIKAVQQVLNNLLISQIEIRTEESIDIKRYSHERKVEKVVVPLGDELTKVKTKYIHIMEVVVNRLKRHGVLYNRDTTSLSKFLILKARDAFRQNPPERLQRNQYGIVEGDFALAMSLYHGYELLQLHGSRSLYNFLDGILTGDKGYGRTRTELTRNADFNELMGLLSGKYTKPVGETPSQAQAKPFVIGHPKMEKLQEIVVDHFNTHSDDSMSGFRSFTRTVSDLLQSARMYRIHALSTTRVMIFSQYRDSVQEITDMLHVHQPVVKVMSFIGQATAGKSTKGFTQKEQLKVMKQFREGGYNTLVSTCVGEEGLDIGDVDLIICFDAHKSPIRLVQRMGRTGRKREGRIVMLVTQGKEEQIYNQSQYSKKSIHKAILNGAKSLHFYQHSPRLLPDNFTPTCHKMHITVKENFRPTKKITTDKDVNQSKITSMMSDAASKKAQSEEIITLEEYRELEPWLVPEEDIPKLPPCKLTCLEKVDMAQSQEEEGRYLSLSEWSPWQNTLQETVHVGHSLGSKHLVQLMEFLQLQQSLDSDDDPYGLEMAAYLNEEDIVQPEETDAPSILRFCVSKKNENHEELEKKGQKKGGKAKSRRSDNLPKFDFLDDKANDSSDEDLPAFNVDIDREKENDKIDKTDVFKKRENDKILSESDVINDMIGLGKRVHEVMDISDDDGKCYSEVTERKRENSKKPDLACVKKPFVSKAKSLEKRMSIAKIRKKKKSRHDSGHTSVIKLIADSDSNDFDGAPEVSVIVNEEPHELDISESLERHKAVDAPKERYQNLLRCSDSELDTVNGTTKDSVGCFRIRTPPPIEDVDKLCEALEKDANFGNIDLFAAIDEWHMENKDGKYIVYPENMMNESFLNYSDKTRFTEKKLSISLADNKVTSFLSHDVTERKKCSERKKSSRNESDTSIELELSKDNCFSELINKSTFNSDSPESIGSKREMKKSSNSSPRVTEKCQTSAKKETVQQSGMKSTESILVCDSTTDKFTDQNEDDDIACTGNFMLNADDVLLTDDDMLDEAMSEYSSNSKEHLPTVSVISENGKAIQREGNYMNQCDSEPASCKKKHKIRQVSLYHSDSFVANKLDKVDKKNNIETKHSFVDLGPIERLNSSNESAENDRMSVPFSDVNKGSYNSFLADDKDDDILMHMKTPVGSKVHETSTQITFTQALNFVHSGSRTSRSESCSESIVKETDKLPFHKNRTARIQSPRFSLTNSLQCNKIEDCNVSEGFKKNDNMEDSSDMFNMSEGKSETTKLENKELSTERKTSRKSSSSSEDGVEMPEFDLGFDFDEDVIPPSPKATQASQKPASSRLSQIFTFSHRLSQSRCVGEEFTLDNEDQRNGNITNCVKSHQHANTGSALSKRPKSKKSLNLQDLEKAVVIKPFQDNEEESQSLLDDNVNVPVRCKKGTSSAMHRFGKVNLETVLENAENKLEDAEVVMTKNCRNPDLNCFRTCKESPNESKRNLCDTMNIKDADVEQGFNGTGEFETSFALLGEDLEDWIDSGVEPKVKKNQKHVVNIQMENENSLNEHGYDSSPPNQKSVLAPQVRPDPPVATVNPINYSQESYDKLLDSKNRDKTSHTGTNKHIRNSIFVMDDLSLDSFDDSFTFTSDMIMDKNTPKNSGSAMLRRHDTSTPMSSINKRVQNVKPCFVTESTPSRAPNTKEVRGMEATPIRATNNTSFRVTDNTTLAESTPSRKPNTKEVRGMEATPIRATNNTSFSVTDNTILSDTQQGNNQTFQDSPRIEPLEENDDSFIVRRKKRVQILDSPFSQKEGTDTNVAESQNDRGSKVDNHSVSDNDEDDFDDSVMLTKNEYIVKKTGPSFIDHFSDEDFEEAAIQSKKQIPWQNAKKKAEISVGNRECNSKVTKKVKLKRGANRKRTSNPFIDEEAELSEEGDSAASSDEHEGSDLDVYEGSFIANSQFTESQALDQTDIHALYLKSVKSPLAQRGGFKLQFNHRNDTDVFSQRPPPEESHYMEDSFCVGSEEEEDAWLGGEEESDSGDEAKEITLMHNSVMHTGRKRRRGLQAFQTSRQREIQMGRMKALSEIRSKLAGKASGKTANRAEQKQTINKSSSEEETKKQNTAKRSRIQILDDTSSDDENRFHFNRSDLMSPKVQPVVNTNKRARRVLSSDDSESEEFYESRSMCRSNKSVRLVNSSAADKGKTIVRTGVSSTLEKQTADELRQERLKKQKEKQAEFKRLMEEKQKKGTHKGNLTDGNVDCPQSDLTRIKEKSEVTNTIQGDVFEFAKPTRQYETDDANLLTSSSVRKSKFSEKLVILVDSKEISGSQDIISDLRFKHDILVSAAQLSGCDYIVSNRMAVERKQWSEFSNGSNRTKLIERMQHLGELYDRPCLIVEKDRVKPGEEKSTRPVHWTKYVDRTLAMLLRTEIKVMFTDNYTETAGVLADLCRLEQRKNMAINVPIELNEEQLNRVKFFVSIPKLSYIHALNLCEGFKSLTEFLKSSATLLECLGKMSKNRAIEVYNYVRREFDSNMLPSSYK